MIAGVYLFTENGTLLFTDYSLAIVNIPPLPTQGSYIKYVPC